MKRPTLEPRRLVGDYDLMVAIMALEDIIKIRKLMSAERDESYKEALHALKKARKRDLKWGDV